MRKAMLVTGMSIAMLGSTATAANAAGGETVPGPDQFKVQIVSAAGSGCPGDSAKVNVTPENAWFTITYDEFVAWQGPGSKKTDSRKFCQLGIDVDVPSGFTFTIVKIDHRGVANLAKGATAYERGVYYWSGDSETTVIENSLTGPFDKDWQFTDEVETGIVSLMPCGEARTFNAKLDLGVRPGTSNAKKEESTISLDSTDVNFSTEFQLKWETC
ncbi:hypothetical protein J2S43_005745 [Catenuloplanes nepalensis]|uniref:DUF4360 domain-containing protein n=1 Tax=Catenuloplanes nepalensis TaxID=587533 RepID=A0ABT9N0L3_9ACTN|nr:DUF4360 domain-containing protein [Catenuloplanes nepalensis]MDP9797233.1 hypothetical protein [Catenuloplanes nepalensis]